MRPWVSGFYTRSRQRFGYEIDARTRFVSNGLAAGADWRVAAKTRLTFSARREGFEYDAATRFLEASLAEVLNRTGKAVGVQLSHELTPYTTLVILGEAQHDEFERSATRDSNSARVEAGFELDPRALIFGRARIGFRTLDSVGGGLPGFRGVTARFEAGSTLRGRVRIDLAGERDVQYSFQTLFPYYLLTGATLTATPQLTDKWDVRGRVGGHRLAYRSLAAGVDRTDSYAIVGAGVGYRLGRDVRVALMVDRQRRESPLQLRDYHGYRVGMSVTYGQ